METLVRFDAVNVLQVSREEFRVEKSMSHNSWLACPLTDWCSRKHRTRTVQIDLAKGAFSLGGQSSHKLMDRCPNRLQEDCIGRVTSRPVPALAFYYDLNGIDIRLLYPSALAFTGV